MLESFVQEVLRRWESDEKRRMSHDDAVVQSSFHQSLSVEERVEVEQAIVRSDSFEALKELRRFVSSAQGAPAFLRDLRDLLDAAALSSQSEAQRVSAAARIQASYSNKARRAYRKKEQ